MQNKDPRSFLPLENCKRLVFISLGLAFFFSLLLAQFYRIQIVEGDKWSKKAKAQHQLTVIEPYKRGTFYSNTSIKIGHLETPLPFVTDVPKFHLYADVTALPVELRASVISALSEALQYDLNDQKQLQGHMQTKSRGRKLASWMDQKSREEIEAWWFPFARKHKIPRNALFFVQDFKRSYPYGKMLGQILHTVREVRDPSTQEHIPTGGLELMMNPYLKGKEGKRILLRSPRNALDFGTVIKAPEDGADVFLTINHYLQAISEEEIAKAVIKANAKSGWAIMMDPNSGEILAWAQYPWFEPGSYSRFFNNESLQKETKCKGITDPFEPGSIFKPITVLICLKANEELKRRGEAPLFSPDEKIATSNGYFPGRSSPIRDTRVHRYLNMYMGLQKSSNIYVARLIQRVIDRLGDQWYRDCLEKDFGFGLKTGIELPSESGGLLPTPGKLNANGTLQWSKPTPFSLSFGYNILTNSLQMVKAFGILANGGYDVQPTLVRKIVKTHRDGQEEVLLDLRDKGERKALFEGKIIKELHKALQYTTKPGGCAAKGDIFGYTEIGKTGTSEKVINGTISRKDHISSFIGWSPAKDPRFVLMVVIDEPEKKYIPGVGGNQFGGTCAAPAFCSIGKRALEYLGVAPDDPYGFPLGDPRRDPDKAIWVKESKSLLDLYHKWND
jgi:cell division protein FtsI (penicillin-binding protein 3)